MNNPLQGVIKANQGAFAASFQNKSRVLNVTSGTPFTPIVDTYSPNPDCPYFFIYGGVWLIDPETGAFDEPDIYVNLQFNFLSGGVTQSQFSALLFGGTNASGNVNLPLINLNYDPESPSLAYCNSVGCVGIGGNNPPTSWAFGTRWTSVVDKIQVITTLVDATTQEAPANYAFMNALMQLPWG